MVRVEAGSPAGTMGAMDATVRLLHGETAGMSLKRGPPEKEQALLWGLPGEPQVPGVLSWLSISGRAQGAGSSRSYSGVLCRQELCVPRQGAATSSLGFPPQ